MSNVSCETSLAKFEEILQAWNRKIALTRDPPGSDNFASHLEQCRAIAPLLLHEGPIADVGSGSGLPIIPALIYSGHDGTAVSLVEADKRKAAFLRAARRATGLRFDVLGSRLEALPPLGAGQITAQAFAPLPRILALVARHLRPDGEILALKGPKVQEEIDAARREWDFVHEAVVGDPAAGRCVLRISSIRPR